MNSFYIVTNSNKDINNSVTERMVTFLKNCGKSVITDAEDCEIPEHIDCVLSVGGDGTMIQAVKTLMNRDAAFAGVNMGTVGFLPEIEPDSLEQSLKRIVDGEYELEERMMLSGSLGNTESLALNDIVLFRTGEMQIIDYRVYVNDRFLTSFRADGVIVSTPTGSTGYNLSAGGPIVEPLSRVMVITPICNHALTSRSVVLCENDKVRIDASWHSSDGGVIVSFDGEENIPLSCGDSVNIAASDRNTKIVRLDRESFVTALSRKLR